MKRGQLTVLGMSGIIFASHSFMSSAGASAIQYRFADFEVDTSAHCLRRHGIRLKLQPLPFQTLLTFLERPGELITREELQAQLWPAGTFVDFDQGLNVAIKKLRDTLCDSADLPRYIETVSGQGYRWIAEVEVAVGNGPRQWTLAESSAPSAHPGAPPQLPPIVMLRTVQGETPISLPVHGANKHSWRLAPIAVAIAVAVLLGFLGWRSVYRQPPSMANGSGWVLIANFENRTGNPVFDGALEYALERELSNSQFVKVAAQERVEDALRLMRKPSDSRIDAVLGREVCLRDGEIHALITGRVETLGSSYILSAEIVNPSTGVTLASFTEESKADSDLAATVRRVSNRVRARLGEDPGLIRLSSEALEKVTTPSLQALQLFTRADRAMQSGGDGQKLAEQMLRDAIKTDPEFASAYMHLAWAIRNQTRPSSEWQPYAEHAFKLANQASDRERYFIVGGYSQMLHQYKEATAAYEILVQLYPDHYWGISNLARLVNRPALWYRKSDLRPRNLGDAAFAWNMALANADAAAAERYLKRALEVASRESFEAQPDATVVLLAPVIRQLSRRDTAAAHAELARLEASFDSLGPNAERSLAFYLGNIHCYLGQLNFAEKWFRLADPDYALDGLAQVAYARRAANGIHLLRQVKFDRNAVALLALNDDRPAVREALAVNPKTGFFRCAACGDFFYNSLLNLEISVQAGDDLKILTGLREQLANAQYADEKVAAASLLAHHLERDGDLQSAADALASLFQEQDLPLMSLADWAVEAHFHLSELYRHMGRFSDAEKVETELRLQLMFADTDHPILLGLQKR